MAVFKVEGGHRLCGELIPQGAKNEALEILSAVLLTPERVVVHNVPDILDVNKLIEMLGDLGVKVGGATALCIQFQFKYFQKLFFLCKGNKS